MKGTTGAELGVSGQNLAINAANEQALFAPVELEGFAEFEFERDEGSLEVFAAVVAPAPDVLADAGVTTGEAELLQLPEQRQGGAPVALGSPNIGFEPLLEPISYAVFCLKKKNST